jgi:hypothetical protein
MADQTFTLNVEISTTGAQTSLKQIQAELDKTAAKAKNLSNDARNSFTKFGKAANALGGELRQTTVAASGLNAEFVKSAGPAGAAAAAIIAVSLAAFNNTLAMQELADTAAELADSYGLTTDQLSAYDLLAAENNTTTGALISTYDKLGKSLVKVAEGNEDTINSFRDLGIAEEELIGLSNEQVAGKIIENFDALGRSIEATAAAGTLLGRNFRENIPAIREAAGNLAEYQDRVADSAPTEALKAAAAAQEKATSDLGLAWKSLKNDIAESTSGSTLAITEFATWGVKQLDKYKGAVLAAATYDPGVIGIFAKLTTTAVEYGKEREKQAREETERLNKQWRFYNDYATKVKGTFLDLSKVLGTQPSTEPFSLVKSTITTSTAITAKEHVIPQGVADTLTKATQNLNKEYELLAQNGDLAAQSVTKLAYELQAASKDSNGKFLLNFNDALAQANSLLPEFQRNLDAANQQKYDAAIRAQNDAYETQIKLLVETNKLKEAAIRFEAEQKKRYQDAQGNIPANLIPRMEKEAAEDAIKQRRLLRAETVDSYHTELEALQDIANAREDSFTTQTAIQAKTLAFQDKLVKGFHALGNPISDVDTDIIIKRTKQYEDLLLRIQKIDIAEGVRDSAKDLGDELSLLQYQTDHFWESNAEGAYAVEAAYRNIAKQIDPEGRGENLTDEQEARLRNQLQAIENQKALLEMNEKIKDSFVALGDATAKWAVGSENAIEEVRLALVRLVLLEALKASGLGQSGGIAGAFIQGVSSGLSGARAEGGPVSAGKSYLVGEEGPEIVKFTQNGYVVPNSQIASTNNSSNITFAPNLIIQGGVNGQSELDRAFHSFSTEIASQVQQMVLSQTGNGGILRSR